MTCWRYRRAIALLVGGELPAAERQALEAHLGACAACRALVAGLGGTHALVRELAVGEAGPVLAAAVRGGVMSRLREQERARPYPAWHAWSWLAASAAAVVVVACAALLLRAGWPGGRPPGEVRARAPIAAASPEPSGRGVPARVPPSGPGPAGQERAEATTATTATPAAPRRRRPAGAPAAISRAPEPEPAVIKILTDDPDVVIYCIVNEREG